MHASCAVFRTRQAFEYVLERRGFHRFHEVHVEAGFEWKHFKFGVSKQSGLFLDFRPTNGEASNELSFEIDAANLEEAVAKFAAGAKGAFERTVRELEEYRRQSASSIVIPDRGAGGFGPGGLPGGGKLQIP